jgi:hypothetical protein
VITFSERGSQHHYADKTFKVIMELLNLPSELISNIISYLGGKDVQELSSVNHILNKLCNCHRTWYEIIKQYKLSEPSFYDFSLDFLQSMSWVSIKSFYVDVLRQWDWLVGFWSRCTPVFGGLLFVKLEMSSCRIIGYDVQGKNLEKNLVPVFIISIDQNECNRCGDDIRCVFYSKTEHSLTINFDAKNPTEFRICCSKDYSIQDHDKDKVIADLADTVGVNNNSITNAIFNGFRNGGITYAKINMPIATDGIKFLEPGFFAGDYSNCGTEILLLKYASNCILLEKLIGDRNVRSGSVSVSIDLTCPIDYIEVLKFITKRPDEFNVKNVNEHFKIKDDSCLKNQIELQSCFAVDKSLLEALRIVHPDRTFGVDDSNSSFIAAFKGKITLGMMPDAVVPDYFYYEVLAVITSQDRLCVFFPFDESYLSIFLVREKIFKRLYF